MRIGIEARQIFKQRKSASDQLALDLIHGLMAIDRSNEYYIFVEPGADASCLHDATNFHVIELQAFSTLIWEQVVFPRAVERYALDILHCTTATGLTKTNTPTLMTVDEDLATLIGPASTLSLWKKFRQSYRRHKLRRMAKDSWGIVASCQYDRKLLERNDRQLASKTRVIHPGVSNYFLYEPFQSTRPEHLPADYLLYFGGANPRKNMRNTLKAYELYTKMTTKDVMPLVIADVTGDELQQYLNELGIARIRGNIRLVGKVPRTQLPSLYRHASILLSPVLRDSNAIQLIEAMACGTVVLTSNTSCLGEVGGKAGYLVNPFSPEEISHGIFKILHDREARKRMLEKSQDRVKYFRWTQVARRYQNIYMESMADRIDLPFSSEDLIPS